MSSVRDLAVSLSISSVIVAFVTFLVPDGALKKTVSSVVTLFFMCVCIIPVFGADGTDIDFSSFSLDDLPDEADFIDDSEKFYLQSGESIVSEQIDNELKNICIAEYSFDVEMQADDQGNIVLEKIEITVSKDDSVRMAKIITEIGSLTGMKPVVEVR